MKLDLTDLPEGTYTLTRTKDGYSLERQRPVRSGALSYEALKQFYRDTSPSGRQGFTSTVTGPLKDHPHG